MIFLLPVLAALGLGSATIDATINPVGGYLCYKDCSVGVKGKALIRQFEGYYPVPYKDSAGLWTIGYGHLIQKGEKFDFLTPDQAEALLIKDLSPAQKSVNVHHQRPLTGNENDSLVSFAFNLGGRTLGKSTLIKKVNEKSDTEPYFLMYNKVRINGQLVPIKGLTIRRKAEAAVYGLGS